MLTIYRPYQCPVKTSFCLSAYDACEMKHHARLLIGTICQICGWKKEHYLIDIYAKDPFVMHYFNDGKPDMNFLLDYYFAMHLIVKKSYGERFDFLFASSDKNNLFLKELQKNSKKKFAKTSWPSTAESIHKLYLLKSDWHWYKRHFRKIDGLDSDEIAKKRFPRLAVNGKIIMENQDD